MAEKVNKTYRYSYKEKMKIVNEYYKVGGSTYSLARKYNIPRGSIKNWIQKFRKNGYIEQEETRGKSSNGGRISLEDYIQLVEEWIEFYNTDRIKGKKVNKRKGYKKNDK